uniref:(northern house mosquito) hypothetical protein n=1 Tax=Culex pipiens TaxID=7175 RepID=A0A8D8N7Q6_CULPI
MDFLRPTHSMAQIRSCLVLFIFSQLNMSTGSIMPRADRSLVFCSLKHCFLRSRILSRLSVLASLQHLCLWCCFLHLSSMGSAMAGERRNRSAEVSTSSESSRSSSRSSL